MLTADSNLKNKTPTIHFRSHDEVLIILDNWGHTLPIPGVAMLFNCAIVLSIIKEGFNTNSVILLIMSIIIAIYVIKIATTSNFISDNDANNLNQYYYKIPELKIFLDLIKKSNRKILSCEYKECIIVIKAYLAQHN